GVNNVKFNVVVMSHRGTAVLFGGVITCELVVFEGQRLQRRELGDALWNGACNCNVWVLAALDSHIVSAQQEVVPVKSFSLRYMFESWASWPMVFGIRPGDKRIIDNNQQCKTISHNDDRKSQILWYVIQTC